MGLLTLALKHTLASEEIERAVKELLEIPTEDFGHASDACYDRNRADADQLLKRLGITVSEPV